MQILRRLLLTIIIVCPVLIHAAQVSDDLQKGIIDAQEAGVKVNNGNINIDLNKTQTLLNAWSKKIDGYVKEFDEIAKEIEDNRTKETD